MVDTRDLKSLGRNAVWVRVPPEALGKTLPKGGVFCVPRRKTLMRLSGETRKALRCLRGRLSESNRKGVLKL